MPNSEEPLFLLEAALRLLPSGFVGWHRSAGLWPMLVSDDGLGSRSITLSWPHLWHSPREDPATEGFLSCQRNSLDILYLKR